MSADQRLTAAREYLGHAREVKLDRLPPSALMRFAAELRRQLGQVLDVVTEMEAADAVQVLAHVRLILDGFDWDHDDRQWALERIDEITGGGDR
jgi:hypothetical protein